MSKESLNKTYLNAVAEVATLAGDFAMRYYKSSLEVETKGDGSPVTIADKGAEEVARKFIGKHFPHDSILGEEFGDLANKSANEAIKVDSETSRYRWFIDPIDGTKSFVRGVPLWGTLVAIAEGDQVIAGCAYFPAVGEIVTAAIGEGCFWNDIRCSVSNVSSLDKSTVLITDDRFIERPERRGRWQTLAESASVARTWGDCYGYLLVATGRAEAMIDDIVSPWDAAALYPIITEAGGIVSDWNGDLKHLGGDIIATNKGVASEVRTILSAS